MFLDKIIKGPRSSKSLKIWNITDKTTLFVMILIITVFVELTKVLIFEYQTITRFLLPSSVEMIHSCVFELSGESILFIEYFYTITTKY